MADGVPSLVRKAQILLSRTNFSGQCCFFTGQKDANSASKDQFQWPMLFLHWSERRKLCPEERVSVANAVPSLVRKAQTLPRRTSFSGQCCSFTGQKGANSALENEFQWLNIVLRRSTQLRAIKEGIPCFMKYQPPTQSGVSQQIRPPTQSASVRSVCARRSESGDTSPDSLQAE